MLTAALRDLQWRRRRFAIAILGTALVFGMTLVLTGISEGFDAEAERTVAQLDVDGWVVSKGSSGPFLGSAPLAAGVADTVAGLPGVRRAAPFVFTRKSIFDKGSIEDVNVFGAPATGPGLPQTNAGRRPRRPGEIAISTRVAGYGVGDDLLLAGQRFRIVGEVADATVLAGTPNVYVTLADAQELAFAGQQVASAIVVQGRVPPSVPAGLTAMDNDVALDDFLRAIRQARSGLTLTALLLWVVAATIIGSVIYVSALERQRDFAVFKATGVATAGILAGLAIQAVVLSVGAAVIGSGIASVLGPNFPMPVSIPARAHLLLPVVAVVVGLVASLAGLRRVIGVDPALAFGGP